MSDPVLELRNKIAVAISTAIPGYDDITYFATTEKVLEAIADGQCAHEWNWDSAMGAYWCSSCEAAVSIKLATDPGLVRPSLLDEIVDRPGVARTKPVKR